MKLALIRLPYSSVYKFYSEDEIQKRDILTPYQLLVLADYIKKKFKDEVDVRIFDGEVLQKNLLNEILKWKPDIVGISATTPEIGDIVGLCVILKKKLDCTTVIGGAHISGLYWVAHGEMSFPKNIVDYLCAYEGEKPLEHIIISHQDKSTFNRHPKENSLLYGQTMDVEEIGKIDYSLLNLDDYHVIDPVLGFVKTASLFGVRGCPYSCHFCFANRNYRRRNVDDVIEEIKYLYSQGVRQIIVNDETLTANKKNFLEFTDKIIKLKYDDLVFQGLTRCDRIDDEIAKRLYDSNFRRMYVGVESGDERILEIIGKRIKIDKIKKGIDLLRKNDIIVRGSFILGLPTETHETINKTIDLSKELDIQTAAFNIAMPYPGTELYNMAVNKQGIKFTISLDNPDFYAKFKRWGSCITRTKELSSEDLLNLQKKANDEFYNQQRIIDFYEWTYKQGNKEKFWHRPLQEIFKKLNKKDLPYWKDLR